MSKPKKRKVAGFMRQVLTQNLMALFAKHLPPPAFPHETAQFHEVAKRSGLSYSTVQRIVRGETGASLDNIEALAEVFDLSVYQLMIPELDVGNPQIVQGAAINEQKAYRRWKREPSPVS